MNIATKIIYKHEQNMPIFEGLIQAFRLSQEPYTPLDLNELKLADAVLFGSVEDIVAINAVFLINLLKQHNLCINNLDSITVFYRLNLTDNPVRSVNSSIVEFYKLTPQTIGMQYDFLFDDSLPRDRISCNFALCFKERSFGRFIKDRLQLLFLKFIGRFKYYD